MTTRTALLVPESQVVPPTPERPENTGRRMLVGGGARVLSVVVRIVVGFFMMPFLVRSLGDYWYGVFTVSVGLIGNFHLMDFGFSTAITREVAAAFGRKDEDGVNRTVNTALWIYLVLGTAILLFTTVLVALAPLVVHADRDVTTVRLILFLAGLELALDAPVKAVAGILHAKLRYDLLVFVDLTIYAAGTAVTVLLLNNGHGVVTVGVVSVLSAQANNVAYFLVARRLFPGLQIQRRRFDRAHARTLASYSTWTFLFFVANHLRFRIDSITVGALFGAPAITRYAIGARLVELAQSPLVQISGTALPALTRLHVSQSHERVGPVVIMLIRFNILLSIWACGLVLFLSGPFISRWMGPEYRSSATIASLLAIGFFTEVALMPLTNWLFAAADHRMLAKANMTEAAANLVLSVVLGSLIGPIGIAFGTVVPLLVVQLFWVTPYGLHAAGLTLHQFGSLGRSALVPSAALLAGTYFLEGVASGNGYLGVVTAAVVVSLVYWPVAVFAGLERQDRETLWTALPLPSLSRT